MKNNELLGLDPQDTKKVAKRLNQLLSDYHVYYINLRGVHWNLQAHHFFVLHEEFEELYNAAAETIDEIAERIITIGERPLHTMEEYVKQSTLKSKKDIAHPELAVDAVIEDQVEILKKLRDARAKADESGDVATVVMLEDFLVFIEKKIWMLNAWRQQPDKK